MNAPRDPAVEAAQREWARTRGRGMLNYFNPENRLEAAFINVARYALAPLRELHKPFAVVSYDDESWHECESCHGSVWPCPTARLIYPESEL